MVKALGLPEAGRWQRPALTEGTRVLSLGGVVARVPSTACGGPPPRAGEDRP
ncbi:hypothetical protein HNO88_001327 [Novosphingobium chloroacetimidivorans]|uniref:Uncharacterized protein n=1 Tax=Novosphingobium chloroacetimidivorans TaxID=1428314 RepID=A0A7W7K9F1_9SPHN|nr:hypothetical protein [Novosphingobium chloroacetimidivorans]